MRHRHSHEEEVVLRTNSKEQVLGPGMCAGFPAAEDNGHQLVKRSPKPARYLEVSNRQDEDVVSNSDVDLHRPPNGRFTHQDGTAC